jgi:hypothetical protein
LSQPHVRGAAEEALLVPKLEKPRRTDRLDAAFSRSTPRLSVFSPSKATPWARPPFGLPNISSTLWRPSETPYWASAGRTPPRLPSKLLSQGEGAGGVCDWATDEVDQATASAAASRSLCAGVLTGGIRPVWPGHIVLMVQSP